MKVHFGWGVRIPAMIVKRLLNNINVLFIKLIRILVLGQTAKWGEGRRKGGDQDTAKGSPQRI